LSIAKRLVPSPGLRVLITGGAAGIGATIARAFAETGAKVHVCDVDREAIAQIGRSNPAIKATCADVVNAAQIEAVFDAQEELFGGLDVLVNNAGIAGPTGGIDSITESEWMRTVDVNLNAQFRFARLAVPLLKDSTEGHILCMSSVAGRLGYAWRTPYAATKWAILGLVKSLAAELGPCGVRVNALLPGFVEGERIDRVIRARAEQAQVDESRMREEYLGKISLRRMVTAEDVAAAALFLCSPAARNITGQTISIDGNVESL
jgi:NAD(P)-dependent dehydrogenase (short-subunit alcohol dehydrogenase family)